MESSIHFHHHAHTTSLIALATVCAAFVFLYLWAALRQKRRNKSWSPWRCAFFSMGMVLLGAAFSPSLVHQAHHNLSAHMLQHLLIGMFAPIALVMSAPLALLLRTLPLTIARKLVRFFSAPVFFWISHPVMALVLNIGGMYILYLTPLYVLSQQNTIVHYFVHWHFLVAGYLFVWSLIGPDPLPHKHGAMLRIMVLFVAIAAHTLLTKLMYALHIPANAGYSAEDIEYAAKLMYYGGDIAELIVAAILFAVILRSRPATQEVLH